MENKTLMTDYYEISMAKTYYDQGSGDEIACFDVFFRRNPFKGGYTVSGGLDNIIEFINNFNFNEEDIKYISTTGNYSNSFLDTLKNMKFTGDLYAIPDGTPIFPNEPIITIKTNILEAQLIETALLSHFNHGSLCTTAAKRITEAANGIPVMEFGARRARGVDSAIEASKYAYVGGCVGTSNTYTGKKYKIPVMGTMAHSLIMAADNEYSAFLNYAKSNPDNTVFLVDTYDTLNSGIPNAIKVAKDYLIPNGLEFRGIRIDSGDLAYLSKMARKMLDEAGFENTKICLSNGLNEETIKDLINQGAVIDSLGIGDNIAASLERVDGVYKLSAITKDNELVPKIKISNDGIKTTNPDYKKVYRFYDKKTGFALGDVITCANEKINLEEYTLVHPIENWKETTINNYIVRELQEPIFINGKLVYNLPNVNERQQYCFDQMKTLYPEVKRSYNPHEYYVDLSQKLLNLKKELIMEYKVNNQSKKLVKKV